MTTATVAIPLLLPSPLLWDAEKTTWFDLLPLLVAVFGLGGAGEAWRIHAGKRALRDAHGATSLARATMKAILDGSPDAVAVLDQHGHPISSNAAMVQLLNRPVDLPQYGGTMTFQDFLTRTAAQGHDVNTVASYTTAAQERSLVIRTRAVQGYSDCRRTLAFARDVTDTDEVVASRNQMLNTLGHELRTPLTVILGRADLLIDLPDARESATLILKAAERQRSVIDGILREARPHIPRAPGPVDLSDLIHNVMNNDAIFTSDQRSRVHLPDRSCPSAQVRADWQDASGILTEIVRNALVHSTPDTSVRISTIVEDANVSIHVHDTGPGLSDTELTKAFERFYRSARTIRDATPGPGLGLGRAAKLAHANNATLTLHHNTTGPGVTAKLTMPLLRPCESA